MNDRNIRHEAKKQHAEEAIATVFSDMDVSQGTTKESLKSLIEYTQSFIDTLPD